MEISVNDFVLCVATVNGSGSQSSNQVLVKSLFRMGVPVGGKNLFPSNIAGLPTWYTIRANSDGFVGRKTPNDIVVAMNRDTIAKDINSLKSEGIFLYNSDLNFDEILLRKDTTNIPIPFRKIVAEVTDSVKLRKYLTNMVYVGVLAQLLKVDKEILLGVISDQFASKPNVVETNQRAVNAGWTFAEENISIELSYQIEKIEGGNSGKILIDGNTAGAAGLVSGGATFMAWYPITPSSSLAEGFEQFANETRKDAEGKNQFAVVQAEDELAAISMVIGAGWSGARAFTTTSGPGLSLMAEAAGLSYFAEIPAVIWDVQRVGPSTGLPTRTLQGDLMAAYQLSHGDTKHVVLLPGNPSECFEFGQTCFDLAERLQTLVLVLSDLDLGMNHWVSPELAPHTKNFDRGKVLTVKALEMSPSFARYKDVDGDGIPYRTLPGTKHPMAAYFCRGTGHDENSQYTEDNETFKLLMDRLAMKYETAKKYVPQPIVDNVDGAKWGILAYGSSDQALPEIRHLLRQNGHDSSSMRLRALPLVNTVKDFIRTHERVFVIEQNRDAQLSSILKMEWPELHDKLVSILSYDGLPITAVETSKKILKSEGLQ